MALYLFFSGSSLSPLITSHGRAMIFSFSRSYLALSALICSRWELELSCPLRIAILAGGGINAGGEHVDDGDDEQPKKGLHRKHNIYSRCKVNYIRSPYFMRGVYQFYESQRD